MRFFAVLLAALCALGVAVFLLRADPKPPAPEPEKVEEPEKAAILRAPFVKPELPERELKLYEEARRVILVSPTESGRYIGTFQRDRDRWGDSMRHMAATDPHPRVRAFALRVLIQYKDPTFEGLFRDRLESDDHRDPRRNAAEALGRLPKLDASSRTTLKKAAENDKEELVRAEARKALEKHP